ncbi:MAG: efflux RND transporter periplasmic adaptor subunit [Bryobacterales bacterium]|nr:efflux RND transporter periplasmic adaptor subunit [Bryobacterales bacterium]
MQRRYFSIPILAATAALMCSCGREAGPAASTAPPPQAVRATEAIAADVPLEIAAIGNVEASSTVEVKARVTAPVVRVHFAEGQDVRAGQLLFELDAEPFVRQIAQIEANIVRDVALARQAEAIIARDEATWKNLNAIATRSLQLQKEGILSREQADQAVTNADAAKAAVEAGRAAVESAKAAEQADRARLQETKLLVEYTKIYAPISGRAGAIATKQGSLAKQHDNTLVTLLQLTPVHVTFSVPESLLAAVRKYQSQRPLRITAVVSGDVSSIGQLEFIDNTVDPGTGGIKMKALFANADRVLWPGQFVNVKAQLNMEAARVLVTAQAVQTGPQGKYVWLLNAKDSTVAMRTVEVPRLVTLAGRGEMAVVASGLQAGERVINEGQKRLTPGGKVRLLAAN